MLILGDFDDPTRTSFLVGSRKIEVAPGGGLFLFLMCAYGGSGLYDFRVRNKNPAECFFDEIVAVSLNATIFLA